MVAWSPVKEEAFVSICYFLCNQCVLLIPVPTDTFFIVTNASALGLGGVLQVLHDGEWSSVA